MDPNREGFYYFIASMTIILSIAIGAILWLLLHFEQQALISEMIRLGIAFFGGSGVGAVLMRLFMRRTGSEE